MGPDSVRVPVPDRPQSQVVLRDPEALFHLPQPGYRASTSAAGMSRKLVITPSSPSQRAVSEIFASSATSCVSPSTAMKRFALRLEISSRELLLLFSLRISGDTEVTGPLYENGA